MFLERRRFPSFFVSDINNFRFPVYRIFSGPTVDRPVTEGRRGTLEKVNKEYGWGCDVCSNGSSLTVDGLMSTVLKIKGWLVDTASFVGQRNRTYYRRLHQATVLVSNRVVYWRSQSNRVSGRSSTPRGEKHLCRGSRSGVRLSGCDFKYWHDYSDFVCSCNRPLVLFCRRMSDLRYNRSRNKDRDDLILGREISLRTGSRQKYWEKKERYGQEGEEWVEVKWRSFQLFNPYHRVPPLVQKNRTRIGSGYHKRRSSCDLSRTRVP